MSVRTSPVPDASREEVRVAMALNGGVSLAVWMGGVAVELDSARRAHTGPEPGDEQGGCRAVYHGICEALDRSLVLDILSGASAGGLNGTLLAAAMRQGRRLPPNLIREKWLTIGDFAGLLQPLGAQKPRSIMRGGVSPESGGVFYAQLEDMFKLILGAPGANDPEEIAAFDPPEGQAIRPLDPVLDVTMTNVVGEPRLFLDVWGQPLAAREYRAPLRFRRDSDFDVTNLATAARASASFPVAFEPFRVGSTTASLARLSGARFAVDGGLLENAPIDAAIRLIPSRSATCQVKRFVCYVNAAPPTAESPSDNPTEPELGEVLGYVINVPRDARFVDQLYAVEAARRRAAVARSASENLLTLPYESLASVASSLLTTYRRRRMLIALEDLLEDTAAAEAIFDQEDDGACVSWLPESLDPPTSADEWRWGVHAAERLLHFELDVLALALPRPEGEHDEYEQSVSIEQREAVLSTRAAVYSALSSIASIRESRLEMARFAIGEGFHPLVALEAVDAAFRGPVFDAVVAATEAFVQVPVAGLDAAAQPVAEAVAVAEADAAGGAVTTLAPVEVAPGDGRLSDRATTFLRQALAIEVVRRAFSSEEDVEIAQELLFAQLTPTAGTQIFTAQPFHKRGPADGEQKLTGIRLLHFAGFYRRSWRANDYLWGRLDGATRIVDLLVDGQRARQVVALGGGAPAAAIVAALLPDDVTQDDPRAALIEEALRDATRRASGVPGSVTARLRRYSTVREPDGEELRLAATPVAELRADLRRAIAADFAGHDGAFTRMICARAAQLEVLADELRELNAESKGDEAKGVYTRPLDLPDDLTAAISKIRTDYASGDTLPKKLGRDDADEATSDLALQTISRALIVVLAALRGVNLALGKVVSIGRVPLLPVTGVTSRRALDWVAVTIGVAGATTYIAARLTTADPHGDAPLGALWSPAVLLGWIAALGVFGVALVPLVRAARTRSLSRRIGQGVVALALLAAAVLAPAVLAWRLGHLHFVQLLAMSGAIRVPEAITVAALAVMLGSGPILRLSPIPGWLQSRLEGLVEKLTMTVLVGAVGAVVAAWSCLHLTHVLQTHGIGWQFWAIVSAFAAVAIFPVYIVFGDRHQAGSRWRWLIGR